MPTGSSYRIAYEYQGDLYRITRIVYGSDGSYYVTAPVPTTGQAGFAILTVNYARQEMLVPMRDAVDLAQASHEDKEIKLSHHPDGFLQFSGAGLISGKSEEGTPRGIGVMSWPLLDPARGPAFALAINNFSSLLAHTTTAGSTVVLGNREVTSLPRGGQLVLEGHYFPPLWRRFVWEDDRGEKRISIIHPAGAAIHLRALLPPESCALAGFLGVELYFQDTADDAEAQPGFIFCGSTGNLRQNDESELLGDGIYCFFPVEAWNEARLLDYVSSPPADK